MIFTTVPMQTGILNITGQLKAGSLFGHPISIAVLPNFQMPADLKRSWAGISAHLGDLIDGDVLFQVGGEVSVASSALVVLHHQQSYCAQHIRAKCQIEEHVDCCPDRLHTCPTRFPSRMFSLLSGCRVGPQRRYPKRKEPELPRKGLGEFLLTMRAIVTQFAVPRQGMLSNAWATAIKLFNAAQRL